MIAIHRQTKKMGMPLMLLFQVAVLRNSAYPLLDFKKVACQGE